MSLDHCPTCDRRVGDWDESGMEASDGQRWCLDHVQFTVSDEALFGVISQLDRLKGELYEMAVWLQERWVECGLDERVPFFEIHEAELADGRFRQTVTFVLKESVSGTSMMDEGGG